MTPAEILLLAGSALAVFAISAVSVAVLAGQDGRVPRTIQLAVAPNAERMRGWERRFALAIALFFVVMSQGVLVLYLVGAQVGSSGVLIVGAEIVLAALIGLYLFAHPRGRTS